MSHPTLLTAALDDRYVIEREIGAGRMAVVHLARDGKRVVGNVADCRADAWRSRVVRP